MKKRLFIFGCIILILLLGIYFYSKNQVKEYARTFDCFDQTCKIIIYSTSSKEKILKEAVALSREEETKRTGELHELNNKKGEVSVSPELLEMMKSLNQMEIFVNHQTLTDVWKKRLKNHAIPTLEELKQVSSYINDFQVGEKTLSSKVYDINGDAYLYGYLSSKIEDYLKCQHLTSYMIQIGSNITVGTHYKNTFHTAILHPITEEVIDIVKKNNLSIYTVGIDATSVDGVNYTPIINPETKYPYNYHQSVTVVCKDSILANMLSYKLYSMNLEDGKKLVQNYDIERVVWVENDGEVKMFAKS